MKWDVAFVLNFKLNEKLFYFQTQLVIAFWNDHLGGSWKIKMSEGWLMLWKKKISNSNHLLVYENFFSLNADIFLQELIF